MAKEKLLQLWKDATIAYYGSGDAIMSDVDFDKLTSQLRDFNDPEIDKVINGIYKDETSSTGNIVAASKFTQMLSLRKLHMEDADAVHDLFSFLKSESVNCKSKVLKYGAKYDGMSIKIKQCNGEIIQCLTRGGMDVTDKLKSHPDIIQAVKDNIDSENIHGEMLIKKTMFEKYFQNGDEYKSIRNCVPGILKKKTPYEISYLLNFVPCTDGVNPLNSDVWKQIIIPDTFDEFIDHCDITGVFQSFIQELRSQDFPYQVDGIVIAFHESGDQRVKENCNYPENILALKYKSTSAVTSIIGVKWSQNKTGKLTPVYDIAPVQLDGVTCTHANGYNYEMMTTKKCGVGAKITIIKTGEIIPVVDEVIDGSENYQMPDVEYRIDGKELYATDMEASRKYCFYLGLICLQLSGIGEQTAYKIGEVCNFDIVRLFDKSLKPDIRMKLGAGAVWERFSEFYNIHSLHLDLLIEMLQFEGCGKILSHRIAQVMVGQTKDVKGITGDVLTYILKGDGKTRLINAIRTLKEYGIAVLNPIEINDSTITFEMSNPPKSGITKEQFMTKFKQKYPNAVHTTLTRKTKYLICDDVNGNTSKCLKARKYNVTMITYEEALERMDL